MTFHHSHFVAGEKGRTPLLLLHGTGADEFDLIPLAQDIAPGAPLFSVRGNVVEHGQKRYFHRNADGSFNQDDLRQRTDQLADFIRMAAPQHGLDASDLVAFGFSNGANIASSLLFRHPDVLRGAILLRGMIPFVPEQAPALANVPILLQSGIEDPLIPYAQAIQLADLYRQGGAIVTHHSLPAGHGLTQTDVVQTKNWYDTIL